MCRSNKPLELNTPAMALAHQNPSGAHEIVTPWEHCHDEQTRTECMTKSCFLDGRSSKTIHREHREGVGEAEPLCPK
jgi:hypothetical protein